LQLRFLTTLQGMSSDRSSLVIFPLPLDLISAFVPKTTGGDGGTRTPAGGTRP
jgi:hypothetical protein